MTIEVNIQDENGDPVILDNFMVTLTDSGRDITEELHFDQTFTDSYPIINDSFIIDAKSNDLKVQFIGVINDEIVVQENYIIGADCCHINLISGETEAVV